MKLVNAIKMLVSTPWKFLDTIVELYGSWIPDRIYLKVRFRARVGKKLNLKRPISFNEKLQWLKVNNRKPEYTMMVDKYAVKEYVASKIGLEYIIPTLGVWDMPDDIDWHSLPNQFVLKTTHGGGGCDVIVCKDKSTFDIDSAKDQLYRSLGTDIYRSFREWPYKNVRKRIIAEKYMTDKVHDLDDCKIHGYNDIPNVILVCAEHIKDSPMMNIFYLDKIGKQDVRQLNDLNFQKPAKCTKEYREILEIGHMASQCTFFLKTDFYSVNSRIYFGELSLSPTADMTAFVSQIIDNNLGDWRQLSVGKGEWLIYKDYIYLLLSKGDMNESDQLKDYKFFCFNGKVRCFKVDFDRFTNHKANYYNREAELLPFGEQICVPDYTRVFEKPQNFSRMIEIAEILSQGIPFLRVDLYNIQGKIYFGELTFFPAAGMGKFIPEEWDITLGNWIDLQQ